MLDNHTMLPIIDFLLPEKEPILKNDDVQISQTRTIAIFSTSYFCIVLRRYFSIVSSKTTEVLSLVN